MTASRNSGKPATKAGKSTLNPKPCSPAIDGPTIPEPGRLTMLRGHALAEKTGWSLPTIYRRIAKGLWTKPVRLGAQSSAWPQHEADALLAALVAAADEDAIRLLVARLHADRGAANHQLQEWTERSQKMSRLAARSVERRASRRA